MPDFSRADYETLLYTLTERYPSVSVSTVRLYTNSAATAFVRGEEKIRWYDPQPHPENPDLASTFPHHRHETPDTTVPEAQRSGIKHNRKPALGITFHAPNLPTLIEDCAELGKALPTDT